MSAQPWLDPDRPLEERVRALVADLTTADRQAIALGEFTALTSRGVPEPHYVDAGTGLRDVPGATAFPTGIALGATFDPGLAEEFGRAVGEEARAAGFTVLLGPTLDLARDPRAGRIPEALGEDPRLTGMLGAAHVRGAQSTHLIAQLKHFIAYNGEDRRTGEGLGPDRGDSMDVQVSIGVLQDAYLRPFKAAVEAGAWSMMGSYNRVNGRYVCESSELLAIPRREWGWQGFYCPDFLFAVRDDAGALAAGLDLGALGGPGGRTPAMVAEAPESMVDDLVTNLVRALIGSGLVDHPLPVAQPPSTLAHRALAERVAVASTVLLRNQADALPFGEDVSSLAVIGPSGADAIYVIGGSAAVSVDPARRVTPLDGIRARAGDCRIIVAQGSWGDAPLPVVPASAFTLPDGSGAGVEVEFADAAGRRWSEVLARVDHAADPADPSSRWPLRWRGRLTSQVTGSHRLSLAVGGRASLRVNGEQVLIGSREAERFLDGPSYPLQVVVHLEAGVPAEFEIDYGPGPAITIPPMGLGPSLRLGWQPPDSLLAEAVAAAAAADAAVVLVNQACGEGMDRDSLGLPGDQDELVRQVAAVNPRTVVVLNTPGAVLLPWREQVAAILQVWYPGERFGAALASILFGDREPGGRLPLTFPHRREQLPGGDHGPETVPARLDYDADGGIGYRAPGVREHGAAYWFGHGLGFAPTSWSLAGVTITDGIVQVWVAVENSTERDTVAVVQAYAEVDGEPLELAAVARVAVVARGRAEACVEVTADAFARWDSGLRRRQPVDGRHRIRVTPDAGTAGMVVEVTCRQAMLSIA
ncbi:MAG: glycoside hydrolase family 3 C-terminal domain-containing protein [Propionicimonas sp.]|uniref:glycoside hydrolase family 3 protein n=1 Tax=Propionicimonas sp. TaxID=1955623 RepID=UPI002B1FCFEC|nr:glycoside hydrolase family 3 C-terminal domain-containing protein [Propionicimonas sp.]MEA4945516.1 glycoside hydrolase family 3 C-terminal domain-containing protein [Propionicimonas sp.]